MKQDMKEVADYALIGDMRSAALVHRNGSIEWFCTPRFDSEAVFASMLGNSSNGYWQIAPQDKTINIERRYVDETLVLETTFHTTSGSIRLTDFMVIGANQRTIVRVVEGMDGAVDCTMTLMPRMHYGSREPYSRTDGNGWTARLAPQALHLRASIGIEDHGNRAHAAFRVVKGESVSFVLQAFKSYEPVPEPIEALSHRDATSSWWRNWCKGLSFSGKWREVVIRSAIMLKALCFEPAGSFVAAATTSLPESIGGSKNWDYRYCWLRDASFTVEALLNVGCTDEAIRWRQWLIDVCAYHPEFMHIMYQVDGQVLPTERTLPWLSGFEHSSPVQISNGAHDQFQLGIYGDILRMFAHAQDSGVPCTDEDWKFIETLMRYVETVWQRPGNGIWETRRGGRQYVDSKVMSWVAIDRGLHIASTGGFTIDVSYWSCLKDRMHAEICRAGFDPVRNTFTQYYGSVELDASVLLIPLVGFLPADDERVIGTISAIERDLMVKGYVYRYSADDPQDGIPNEGAFLMCGFWLAEVYEMVGRNDDARSLFERLLATANDVGIFSEEFDTHRHMAIGNIPQAFSHVGAINAAYRLSRSTSAVLIR